MDNTCVIGYGMVGKAMAEVFGIKKIYTRNKQESTITLDDAANCRYIFICLPTPVNEDGFYFLEDIAAIIDHIKSLGKENIFIVRSTVAPGFAQGFDDAIIISNPEFLSEATAVEDVKNPPFIIIGGKEEKYRNEVQALYQARIKGAPFIMTDNITAEMAKLSLNAFFATKVIFANEVYDACQRNGANYETIKRVLETHPYGSKNHFSVWFRGKRGVHGACLPKDSKAFANYANSQLLKSVTSLNKFYVQYEEGEVLPPQK